MAEITLHRAAPDASSPAVSLPAEAGVALAATVLVAVCAQLAVPLPFTPVPLSLAPFAVIFLGLVLAPRIAFASLFLYLCEGAAGLPVFSAQGPTGMLHLLGATGGYLLSYPFAAALASKLYRRRRASISWGILSAGAASFLILLAGACWLKMITHMDTRLILGQAVFPFLPGDMLKVCAASGLALAVNRLRSRRSPKSY